MFKKSKVVHRKPRLDPDSWIGKLKDYPVFILGNGNSLNEIDVLQIDGFVTIGINRSLLKIDSTFLMWQDASFWYTERHNILKAQSLKYAAVHADPERRFYNFELKEQNFRLPQNLQILHGRGTTTPLAVQLAILLGCSPIILLGCDCKKENNQTDFYGNNKYHHPNTMKQCGNGLLWIRDSIQGKNVSDIISCSNNEFFHKQNIIDVIKNLDHTKKKTDKEFRDMLR